MEIGFDFIFLIYVIKSHVFVFLLIINRSRPIGKRTNFVTLGAQAGIGQTRAMLDDFCALFTIREGMCLH